MNADHLSIDQFHALPRVYGPAEHPIFIDSWDDFQRVGNTITQDVWIRLRPERLVYADVRSVEWDMDPVLIAGEGGELHKVSITLPAEACESGESMCRALVHAIDQALS